MLRRASDNLKRFEDEERKGLLADGDKEKIRDILSDCTIPSVFKKRATALIETPHCNLTIIEKGILDKKTKEVGVIIEAKSDKKLLNLSPLPLIENTGEKTFCIRNDQENLIGFFTPFHVILVNYETLKCTRTVENDEAENVLEINVTEYTMDGTSVKHATLKVHPFREASEFIAEYYLREYKGIFKHE